MLEPPWRICSRSLLCHEQKWRRVYMAHPTFSYWSSLYDASKDYPIDCMTENTTRRSELFAAYVGVIFQQDGLKLVQAWVAELIAYASGREVGARLTRLELALPKHKQQVGQPETPPPKPPIPSSQGSVESPYFSALASPQARKRPRVEQDSQTQSEPAGALALLSFSASLSQTAGASGSGSGPAAMSPPSSSPPATEFIIPTGQNAISYLHEIVSKKGLKPVWSFTQNGSSHQPEWQANLTSTTTL